MTPLLVVFTGPNGSGKSTITAEYQKIPGFPKNYINPDQIALTLGNEDYIRSVYQAAEEAERQRQEALATKTSFAFETVMSHPAKIEDMRQAKELGYRLEVIFVCTNDPEINIERVRLRVNQGGHDVPVSKIRERYDRSLSLLPQALELADRAYLYDNSSNDIEQAATIDTVDGQKVIKKSQEPAPWVTMALAALAERMTEWQALASAAAVGGRVLKRSSINKATYRGVIDQITQHFIAQVVSDNEVIVHERSIVTINYAVNCEVRIIYNNGNVHVSTVPTVENQLWAQAIMPQALAIFNQAKTENLVRMVSRGIEICDHGNYLLKLDANNSIFSIIDGRDQQEVASFALLENSPLAANPSEQHRNYWR
jgi:predicted ABC-type ATPase